MVDEDLYSKAEKRVDRKIGFYRHLYAFISFNVVLLAFNFIVSPGHWWFYWITALWAIGLVAHFLKTFVLVDNFDDDRDRMIEEEMKKIKK